ncbi:hypothetical protein BDP81DRAFT_432440 [Colletotrichum phormii]|uniref:Uncharacterized protein n=1 Tax=Colletotrichum phormii TaxID=359342 RepID=A0AAI9ZM77_9PEZI|nr:uncharacterized protein BDP81DRAFT_432440 [Colletotrichum phormii]KAK1634245.1 hypothetical protein BDP81DRAFT_432440 [Colletotrichum phormii]
MVNQPARIPTTTPALARFLPAAITIGVGKSNLQPYLALPPVKSTNTVRLAVSAVALNIRSQLKTESQQMDRFFSKYNNPQSEAARQKVFEDPTEDPRKSWFNALGRS